MGKRQTITVRGAIALGVGSMVGAGIFALMGETAGKAGGSVSLSLLVYSLVNIGAWRLLADAGWHRSVIFSSIVACLLAIGVWVLYTLRTSPGSFSIFLSFIAIAFASEGLLLRYRGRQILPREGWEAS